MIEQLLSWTALPNLHPAIVHFPVAFLPLALAFEFAGLVKPRVEWLRTVATTLYVASAGAAGAAVWAGRRAADGLVGVPATVQPHIGEHSDWGHYALYSVIAVAAVALVVSFRRALDGRRGVRALVLALGLGAMAVLTVAADHGGALVYRHALGVQPQQASAAESEHDSAAHAEQVDPSGVPSERLFELEDGGVAWRPVGDDGAALGDLVTAGPGSSLDAVRVLPSEGSGLKLAVDGATTLLLPGTFGDVMVEAEIEWLDFDGSVGVVHHVSGSSDRGSFSVSSTGTAVLSDHRDGASKELDSKSFEIPSDPFVLAVSSAGRHLKGLVDGRTVTHGHIAAGPEGSCGLQFEGRGTIRIVRVLVQPLS